MTYITSMKTAFLFFPLIAFLFTIPYILAQYHKYGSISFFRSLIVYTFILYLMMIYFLVILPLPSVQEVLQMKGPTMNLVPFSFIKDFIHESGFVFSDIHTYLKAMMDPSFYTAVFNILMTIPFGMYLRYYFKCDLKKTFFFTFCLSLFFELTQLSGLYFIYPRAYRLFDVDDLILNTLGGVIGYFFVGAFLKILPSRDSIDKESFIKGKVVSGFRRITVFLLDAFIVLVLYLFCSWFVRFSYLYLVIWISYYLLIFMILDGQTIGMKFLNVKIEYKNLSFIRNTLRNIFLSFYYCYMPFYMLVLSYHFMNQLSSSHLKGMVLLFTIISFFIFYLFHILFLLITRKCFYDSLFGFKYISTIEEKLT